MSHEVRVHPEAVKRLRRFPDDVQELLKEKMRELSKEFNKPDSKLDVKKIHGKKGISLFRLRVGDYRVVFEFADDIIWIATISHRKDAHKDLQSAGTSGWGIGSRVRLDGERLSDAEESHNSGKHSCLRGISTRHPFKRGRGLTSASRLRRHRLSPSERWYMFPQKRSCASRHPSQISDSRPERDRDRDLFRRCSRHALSSFHLPNPM